MKTINTLFLISIIFFTSCQQSETSSTSTETTSLEISRQYYQLKTYSFDTDAQVQITEAYLKDAFLPALKRIGMANIGVFKPIPNEIDTLKQVRILIPFESMDQFLAYEDQLSKDSVYLIAGATYINAPFDQPPYSRIETVLLRAFERMPFMKASALTGPRDKKVYELRSYESATEDLYKRKVDMFNEGGEVVLFEQLQFNAVFYGEVIAGSRMPNLMYMTTFTDQASRDEHWESFFNSPEWLKLKPMEKYQNTVSKSDKYFLYPTEYSDY